MSSEEFSEASGQYDEDGNMNYDIRKNSESNGKFHTDWLNMMYPRLKLARDLLSNDGAIFISIDDKEVENLKKICSEIFGEDNFINTFAWRRTDNQPNIGNVARVKEYIICFSKNKSKCIFGRLPLTEKAINEYRYSDENGKFRRKILLDKTRGRHIYNITTTSGKILTGPWMIKKEEFERMKNSNAIYWTKGGEEQPYGKLYLSESKGQIPNDFLGIEYGTNQRASIEVEKLFEKRLFSFPKPVSLIKTFIKIATNNNDIILDFFSGSATTAHAVMQLNAEDVGNRKFIMVQLPEETDEKSEARKAGYENICEIGKERIRRAGKKIKEENPNVADKLDTGFRVLKLDSSNMKDVYYNPSDYNQDMIEALESNIKDDRSNEDLLFQVMLDLGELLSSDIKEINIQGKKVFNVGDGNIVACFDEDITNEVLTEIAKMQPFYAIFRDSSLSNDSVVTNFEQIFKTYSPNTITKVL